MSNCGSAAFLTLSAHLDHIPVQLLSQHLGVGILGYRQVTHHDHYLLSCALRLCLSSHALGRWAGQHRSANPGLPGITRHYKLRDPCYNLVTEGYGMLCSITRAMECSVAKPGFADAIICSIISTTCRNYTVTC